MLSGPCSGWMPPWQLTVHLSQLAWLEPAQRADVEKVIAARDARFGWWLSHPSFHPGSHACVSLQSQVTQTLHVEEAVDPVIEEFADIVVTAQPGTRLLTMLVTSASLDASVDALWRLPVCALFWLLVGVSACLGVPRVAAALHKAQVRQHARAQRRRPGTRSAGVSPLRLQRATSTRPAKRPSGTPRRQGGGSLRSVRTAP